MSKSDRYYKDYQCNVSLDDEDKPVERTSRKKQKRYRNTSEGAPLKRSYEYDYPYRTHTPHRQCKSASPSFKQTEVENKQESLISLTDYENYLNKQLDKLQNLPEVRSTGTLVKKKIAEHFSLLKDKYISPICSRLQEKLVQSSADEIVTVSDLDSDVNNFKPSNETQAIKIKIHRHVDNPDDRVHKSYDLEDEISTKIKTNPFISIKRKVPIFKPNPYHPPGWSWSRKAQKLEAKHQKSPTTIHKQLESHKKYLQGNDSSSSLEIHYKKHLIWSKKGRNENPPKKSPSLLSDTRFHIPKSIRNLSLRHKKYKHSNMEIPLEFLESMSSREIAKKEKLRKQNFRSKKVNYLGNKYVIPFETYEKPYVHHRVRTKNEEARFLKRTEKRPSNEDHQPPSHISGDFYVKIDLIYCDQKCTIPVHLDCDFSELKRFFKRIFNIPKSPNLYLQNSNNDLIFLNKKYQLRHYNLKDGDLLVGIPRKSFCINFNRK